MSKKALFLDRDGIICHLVKYPSGYDSAQCIEDVKLVKGIEKVIKVAKANNWLVIETSNQPCVAKGKQTQDLSDKIEARIHVLLHRAGVKVDNVYICQHHPQGVIPKLAVICDCRKPKPGLFLKAAKNHNIDLTKSLVYGDKASDTQAAIAAGCKSILLLHNEDLPEKVLEAQNTAADFKVNNHQEVCKIISKL